MRILKTLLVQDLAHGYLIAGHVILYGHFFKFWSSSCKVPLKRLFLQIGKHGFSGSECSNLFSKIHVLYPCADVLLWWHSMFSFSNSYLHVAELLTLYYKKKKLITMLSILFCYCFSGSESYTYYTGKENRWWKQEMWQSPKGNKECWHTELQC